MIPALRKEKALDNYNPKKGVKKIAVAEAAEKMFARAKDAAGLYEAIATKLGEQRRFVLWWDEQGKHPGNRNGAALSDQQWPKIEELGLDSITVHRWRRKLGDERKFDAELEKASEKCVRICESSKGQTAQRGASGTGENEWYTPAAILDLARAVLGEIDLDPASSEAAQRTVKAARFFDADADGLAQEWEGRVWLNPPYAQPFIAQFAEKMVVEWTAGRVSAAVVLTHNYTDTAWFQGLARTASAICFTRGRIRFVSPDGELAAPTQGQALFYFGQDTARFAEVFKDTGFVVMPWTGEV